MSLNIFSLLPHLDELRMLVDDDKPHIISINETKLDDLTDDLLIHINDYLVIRKDRNKHDGGVAIYIHQNIQFELKSELMCDELKSVFIQVKKMVNINHLFLHPSIDHQVSLLVTLMIWGLCFVG